MAKKTPDDKTTVRYPWDTWVNRIRPFQLKPGIDYFCKPHSMSVQIRQAAIDRGRRASVSIADDGTLTVATKDDL